MKRGYYVHCGDDDAGVAVVAGSAKAAKKIAYDSGMLSYEAVPWIDLRAVWLRDADVGGLDGGLVDDPRAGLLCGVYQHLAEYPCDGCGMDGDVRAYCGRALCERCIEKQLPEYPAGEP